MKVLLLTINWTIASARSSARSNRALEVGTAPGGALEAKKYKVRRETGPMAAEPEFLPVVDTSEVELTEVDDLFAGKTRDTEFMQKNTSVKDDEERLLEAGGGTRTPEYQVFGQSSQVVTIRLHPGNKAGGESRVCCIPPALRSPMSCGDQVLCEPGVILTYSNDTKVTGSCACS